MIQTFSRTEHSVTCDVCESYLFRRSTLDELIAEAKRIGWDVRDEDEGAGDRCHACRSKP